MKTTNGGAQKLLQLQTRRVTVFSFIFSYYFFDFFFRIRFF